jgi:hypothetical protein
VQRVRDENLHVAVGLDHVTDDTRTHAPTPKRTTLIKNEGRQEGQRLSKVDPRICFAWDSGLHGVTPCNYSVLWDGVETCECALYGTQSKQTSRRRDPNRRPSSFGFFVCAHELIYTHETVTRIMTLLREQALLDRCWPIAPALTECGYLPLVTDSSSVRMRCFISSGSGVFLFSR